MHPSQTIIPPSTHRDTPNWRVRIPQPQGATFWHTLVLAAVLTFAAPAAEPTVDPPAFGPLYHEFSLTLEPGTRAEAAGPFLWADQGEEWRRSGWSPLFSHAENLAIDAEEFDILYPFVTYDRFGSEYKLRFSLMTTFTGGGNQQGQPVRRFTLFPFFFSQRSPTPEFNYTAVFPLHGTIRDRLNRSEIRFTLFPLYSQTRKRDFTTRNYLYPLFHQRTGDHLAGWQFWPFYGTESRSPFEKTNDHGNLEFVPGHEKGFALWPFYLRDDLGLGTTNPVASRALLPFYFQVRSPARDSTTWLWPLFTHIQDREKGYEEWQLPFPAVVFSRGTKTANRVLPFYSRITTSNAESGFLAWPIYKVNRFHSPPLSRERERILFFLYSDLHETNTLRQTVLRRTDAWPFFTRRRDHEGLERFQALAPIEPFLPNNKAIERNWSPLFSVVRYEHNPHTQASSTSVLWNLYRQDATPDRKNVSLCFGLFKYQSTPEQRRWRLFYLPAITSTKRSRPEAVSRNQSDPAQLEPKPHSPPPTPQP